MNSLFKYIGPGPGCRTTHIIVARIGPDEYATWSFPFPEGASGEILAGGRGCAAGYSWLGSGQDFKRHFQRLQ